MIAAHGPSTVRVPDLVLPLEAGPADEARFDATEILLAVEIVSPGSRRTDYVAKRYDYEQAGIPFYWIIDPDERRVRCLELVDRAYREIDVPEDGDGVTLPRPVPIRFGWDRLLGRGQRS